jgi:hypothetical protein
MKILYFLLLFLWISSCVYHRQEEVAPSAECPTKSKLPDTVSFKKNILPLLISNCASSGCHSGRSPKGNLSLDSTQAYIQLSKKGSGYIDTIQPAFSILYGVLISPNNPMPPAGPLPPCDIEMIRKWMEQKARKN